MTTYLVDYENTSFHGLDGFKKLDPNDTVVIFLGANNANSSMPIGVVKDLTPLGERPRLLWKRSKKTSKNYLDLQLVSYLGSLIGDPEITETEYVIVSKDHDFEAAIDFWAERRKDIGISLRSAISTSAPKLGTKESNVPAATASTSEATKRAVRKAVKELGLKPSDYTVIYRAFAVSQSAQQLHTKLTQDIPTQGQKVYPLVKEIYLERCGNNSPNK